MKKLATMREEHLHVTNRIEAEATRNAVANDFNDLAGGVIGIGGFDEEEIRTFICGSTKLRHLAPVDLVRIDNDAALRGLTKDLGQPRDRHRARIDNIGQYLSRAYRGQL